MTRRPSVKTLRRCFGDKAREAKRALHMSRQELLETYDAAGRRLRECYNPPQTYDIRLETLNAIGDFHGVEGVQAKNGRWASYLNTGDTYNDTLIYWNGHYRVQSLGDFVETMERNGICFD